MSGTNSKKPKSLTTYELRKASVNREAAKALFSRDFARSAFEAGSPLQRGKGAPPRLSQETQRWVTRQGHEALAIACLAYFLVVEARFPRPDDRSFVGLVRQIQEGATKIVESADELARQISNHHDESGDIDHVRFTTLERLAWALNGSFYSPDSDEFEQQMRLRRNVSQFGIRMTHGLSNCAKLANAAEHFLSDYAKYAKVVREEGASPALPMKKGRRPDRDRDEFVHDLETVYECLFPGKANANRGTGTRSRAVSPFVRFVDSVFRELQAQSYQPRDGRFKTPSVDALKEIKRRRTAGVA